MKTEYNHGNAISNLWQDRNEFRWANRAGEGAEFTFELAIQAAEAALLISAINALSRGGALCDHYAYTQEDGPAILVDILAWRTHSQKDEDARWNDVGALRRAIESLSGIVSLDWVGDIDHENGRGWTFRVTLV